MFQRLLLSLFSVLAMLVFTNQLVAQPVTSHPELETAPNIILETFDQLDGLPVVSLTDMVLGADNHIYIASSGGVSRFNGTDFESISTEQFPQLNSNRIRFLKTSPDSSLWMIDEQGFFSRWKHGQLQTFDSLFSSEVQSEWTLRASKSGAIWIHDTQTFMVYEASTKGFIEQFTIPDKKYYNFVPVSDSLIFILTDEGLFEFSDQKLSLTIPVDQLPFDPEVQMYFYWNTNISQISDYEITAADSGSLALYNLRTKEYLRFPFIDEMQSTPSVLKVTSDELLVTTLNGHFNLDIETGTFNSFSGSRNEQMGAITYSPIWQGKRLYISETSVHYDGEKIFKLEGDQRIAQAVQDKEGNIWLAVAGLGLVKIGLNPFKVLNSSTGLQSDNTYSIIEDQNRNIWIASFEFGVHRVTGESINWWSNSNNSLVNNLTRALYERKDGSIIAGFWDSGLYEFNGSSWRKFLLNDSLLLQQAESFYEDVNGNFWIGSRLGLYKSTSNTDTFYEQFTSSGEPIFRTQVIRENPTDQLWLGTHGLGLLTLREGNIDRVYFSGLEPQPKIRDLYFSTHDTLWVATETNGLIRASLDSTNNIKSFDLLSHKDGLPDFGVHRILPDAFGFFWLTSNQGLSRVSENSLNNFLDGNTEEIWIETFTENDGMPIREANGGTQSNGLVASDSIIWIPTQKGVVTFNPAKFLNKNPFEHTQIHLSTIDTEKNNYQLFRKHPFHLSPDERSLTLGFTLVHFTNPENITLEYRIPALGNSWTQFSKDRQLSITNLPPGTHTIEIKIIGVPKDIYKGETFSLIIPPYFYEQFWFHTLIFGLIVLLVVGFIYDTKRTARKREKQLNDRVLERTKLLNEQKAETEKALQTIKKQAKRLEHLNEVKTNFFINMTHELRTPLTLIKGPLNLLKDASRRQDINQEEQLSLIERNSSYLNNVVDQLLDLLRLETHLENKSKKFDLVSFVHTYASQFLSSEELIGKTILLHKGNEEYHILADPEACKLIVTNLISNALKYTKKNDTIEIKVYSLNQQVVFEVRDTGIGISENDLQHIFDPFYRSENAVYQKGSGVGLSIVKNFIDRIGGTIKIDSELGVGTSIKIYFPKPNPDKLDGLETYYVSIDEEVETNRISKLNNEITVPQPPQKVSSKSGTPHILLVEDNKDLQLFLRRLLQNKYTLYIAGNGVEALEYLKDNVPDLIITDLMMPKMDGISLLKKIRENQAISYIPVIILSAKKSRFSIAEGLSTGAQVYLTKPLDNKIFIAQIESLLDREYRILRNRELDTDSTSTKTQLQINVDDLILRHIADPGLTVEAIAQALHYSRPTLYRKWKEISNVNLNEYIVKTRLTEAVKLIKEKGYTFAEASAVCGFSEPSYFSRVFRKFYKMSPSSYFSKITTN